MTPIPQTSRTMQIGLSGVRAILLLGAVLLVALATGVAGSELSAICETLGTMALGVAGISGATATGHSARHWGAREPSGTAPK